MNQIKNEAVKLIGKGKGITARVAARISMGFLLATAAVTPCFADITNIGENAGGWIQEQAFYIGVTAVAIAMVVFILKKAWIPAAVFIVVAAILLAIIGSPETLQTFGQSLLNRFTQ